MRSLLARSPIRGIVAAMALAFGGTAPSVHAASVTFNFSCAVPFPGSDNCVGASSYGFLTISDTASPNAVDLTWNLSPAAGTHLGYFLLNYQSASAPAGLTFTVPGSSGYKADSWDTGVGAYGQFDIIVGFNPTAPLSGTGTLTALLGGLSAASFEASTAGGNPPLQALYRTATANGIADPMYGAIPAPATLALVGLGLLAVGAGGRRLAKR